MEQQLIKKEVSIEERYMPTHILENELRNYSREFERVSKSFTYDSSGENTKALEVIKSRMKQIELSIQILKNLGLND